MSCAEPDSASEKNCLYGFILLRADKCEFTGKRCQGSAPGSLDEDVILDANPDLVRLIKTGLYGDKHTGRKLLMVSPHDMRSLVNIEAKPMAGLVNDKIGEA